MKKIDNKVKKVSNEMNIENGHLVTFAQKVAQEEDAGTFDFKIKNDGTGVPTEIAKETKKEPSLSEMLRQGFEEEQAQRKKEEEEEDEEETDKFLDDVANNTPNTKMFDHFEDELLEEKNEVIDIDNYERYWDNSTPNGHQIRILKQDNSTLTINLEWPKGKNPRLREVKKR